MFPVWVRRHHPSREPGRCQERTKDTKGWTSDASPSETPENIPEEWSFPPLRQQLAFPQMCYAWGMPKIAKISQALENYLLKRKKKCKVFRVHCPLFLEDWDFSHLGGNTLEKQDGYWVIQAFNLRPLMTAAGVLHWVQGHNGLHSKFQTVPRQQSKTAKKKKKRKQINNN